MIADPQRGMEVALMVAGILRREPPCSERLRRQREELAQARARVRALEAELATTRQVVREAAERTRRALCRRAGR